MLAITTTARARERSVSHTSQVYESNTAEQLRKLSYKSEEIVK